MYYAALLGSLATWWLLAIRTVGQKLRLTPDAEHVGALVFGAVVGFAQTWMLTDANPAIGVSGGVVCLVAGLLCEALDAAAVAAKVSASRKR